MRMRHGLIGLGLLVAASAAGTQPGNAAPRPWCLGDTFDSPRCLFSTFEQCYQTARGLSGYCFENPALQWQRRDPAPPPKRPRR